MKKSININGISTTAAYTDGDCIKLVNLRKKNGVLRPVTPRKVTRTTAEQYVYTFQHNLPNTGKNLIGVRSNNIYLVGESSETLLTTTTGFKSITQTGNMLNVADESGIKHLFWTEGQYNLISTAFGGTQTSDVLGPVKVDLKVENEGAVDLSSTFRSNFRTISSNTILYSNYATYGTADNLALRKETFKGLTDKLTSILRKEGSPVWFMLACTAVELYDGSYILHSAPVLLGQANDEHTRYEGLEVNTATCDYKQNRAIFKTSGQVITSDPSNNTVDYQESTTFGSGKAIKSGTAIDQAWFPSVIGESHYGNTSVNERNISTKATIFKNKLKFRIGANIAPSYSNLIKSVSVFLTPEICPYDLDTVESLKETYLNYATSKTDSSENYYFRNKTNADIQKSIAENQRFYKVHEITFEELRTITPGTWIDIDLKDKIGDNLVNQEALPVDNFTHHSYKPNKQLVYNSKLHIMDYQQELFRPWPSLYNFAQQGIGQFSSEIDTPLSDWEQWIIVTIKTDTGISKVVRHNSFSNTVEKANKDLFLSYPDSRANKIEIITKINIHGGDLYSKSEYTLTSSTYHNFSYWISDTLKPVWTAIGYTFQEPLEIDRTLIYRNAMKVSSVNNPFYFPPETTYTIGTGTILNAGTNAQRMSEGQFGQYDLYVLTTEGMYSLDTGTEISYNRQSPASLEIPISDILCSMPYGVLFIGKRGLYMITGQETQFISAQIEENGVTNSIVAEGTSFSTFVSNLKDILYDNRENEIILVSNTLDYNYVYNIDSKMWYISTEKIDYEIKNSSPNLLVTEGKKIKDYSQQETDKAAVAIITRPMFFGIDEVKKLERSYLRGKFYTVTTPSPSTGSGTAFYSIYGSNDGVQQLLLRGFTIPEAKQNRTYKDFDSGIIARSTYRNYTIAFEATVGEQSEISHIDFEVTDNYNNNKLR